MVRSLLVRGLIAGLVAGLAYAAFAFLFGEPPLQGGIDYEEAAAAAAGEADGAALVGRGVQSTLGLAVAAVVYGVAVGGFFALVHAALYGRIGRLTPRATAAVLALVGFVVVFLVPFLKYPSNPPASSIDGTIGQRSSSFLVMVLLSILLAGAALALRQRLVGRMEGWNATLLAVAAYIAVVGVAAALMPVVAETPEDFPAGVLYEFRLASLGGQLVLWASLGLVFGALVDGRARPARRRAAESSAR